MNEDQYGPGNKPGDQPPDANEPQPPTDSGTPDAGAPTPEASEVQEPVVSDMEEGRTFAILSYVLNFIGLPFFLVPLIMRNNDFALYHAKQCLMIWIAGIAVSLVGSILAFVCIGFIILLAGGIMLLVLNIMGLINAVKGEARPIPVIGKWGEEWFKGLKRA